MADRAMTFEVYKDSAGQWRWRAKAANRKTVADSAEGYVSRRNAERARDAFLAAVDHRER